MANTLQKKHASITHLSLCIWCHFIFGRIFFIFLPDFEHLQEGLKCLGKHGMLFSGKAQTGSANSQITKNGKLFSLCTTYVQVRFRLIWSIIALSFDNFQNSSQIYRQFNYILILAPLLYYALYFRLRAIKLVYVYIVLIRKL